MSIDATAWRNLWQELGATQADFGLLNQLIAAYSERQRHYHTLQHLRECLAYFDAAATLAAHPARVQLALWFHDAVYDPQRSDNEERSATWAASAVRHAGCGDEAARQVEALVLATRHLRPEAAAPADEDTALMRDIDLAILGAAPARFDESEAQIRKEYAHLDDDAFRAGRARVVEGFLARPQLFATTAFRAALEKQARANLERSLARLRA